MSLFQNGEDEKKYSKTIKFEEENEKEQSRLNDRAYHILKSTARDSAMILQIQIRKKTLVLDHLHRLFSFFSSAPSNENTLNYIPFCFVAVIVAVVGRWIRFHMFHLMFVYVLSNRIKGETTYDRQGNKNVNVH